MNTDAIGFKDKNGFDIQVGSVVKFSIDVRVGTQVSGRRGKRETYPITKKMEIVGTVKFGLFNYYFDKMMTFYVDTESETSYDSYFWATSNKDLPKKRTENLSCVLTDKLAESCEIIPERAKE